MEEHSNQYYVQSSLNHIPSTIMEEPTEQHCVIPDDFLFKEILSKVSTMSLLRFKGVSRSWLARISSDSTFIADHTAHHSTAPTEFTLMYGWSKQPSWISHEMFILSHGDLKVVEIDTSYLRERVFDVFLFGTCNGLACISFDLIPDLFIWNPVTREHRHLREPTRPKVNYQSDYIMSRQFYLGFGKDTYIDYKLLRLVEIRREDVETIIDAQLFTKRSGLWRHLNGFSGLKLLRKGSSYEGIGLMVDGTMYWAIRYETPRHQGRAFDVLSFDFCAEIFQELEGPPPTSDESCKWVELIKWKGCLGAVLMDNDKTRYQLWLRTKNNDNETKKNCWKNVAVDPSLHPLHDSGVVKDRSSFGSDKFFGMCDYMPSLVSPN